MDDRKVLSELNIWLDLSLQTDSESDVRDRQVFKRAIGAVETLAKVCALAKTIDSKLQNADVHPASRGIPYAEVEALLDLLGCP